MTFNTWLDTFVEEKGICLDSEFEIQDPNPESLYGTHIFSYGYVVEAIKSASVHERNAIKDMIVRIDFANRDVRHYLRHLAQALVK